MEKKRDHSFIEDMELPQPDAGDLRGRQSVRATFKLSSRAIEALSIVAVHLGIKQKSLFDHLIEDVQTLNAIAQEIEAEEFRSLSRIQKTFVISRRTLVCLDEISRQFNAPRDALVEYSIQRLLPVIQREREKHRRRKRLLAEINQHFQEGLRLVEKSVSALGEEDPVSIRLAAAMDAYTGAREQIEHFIEKADVIEDF
jgi:predicted transcriptional regulator